MITVVRNRSSGARFSQLDGPDGLEGTIDQEPETDESDVQGELHDKDEEEKDKSEVVQPERTVPEDNEDSDKEGDRCGTDAWRRESEVDRVARSRRKEWEADNLQKCSESGRPPDSLPCPYALVGESYDDALWRLAAEAYNNPVLFWACQVCPDKPETDKGEEKSAICNICKNNMELFEVADWMPPLPM